MCQNFRVKLDFCNYYNDIRRFCWIFIDCTKMLQIDDIKKHIKKLFGINDPFDLLLNKNEYLPPREDIRILKENEIILVSPGSHFSSDQFNNLPLYYAVSLIDENKEELEDSAHSEQIEELISQSDKNSIQQEQLSINFPTVLSSQEDLSIDTTNNFQDDAEMYDTTTNTEICNTLPKRNHIRHRKKKIKVDTQLAEEDKSVKSKITNPIISSIISSCKHIGFDIVDDKIVMKDQVICPSNIVDAIHKLENILSSVKSAIPLTFGNDRVKDMTKKEKEEKDNTEDTEVNTVSKNINGNTVSTERLEEINKFLGIDFETYEVMVVRPKVNDIIAFKFFFGLRLERLELDVSFGGHCARRKKRPGKLPRRGSRQMASHLLDHSNDSIAWEAVFAPRSSDAATRVVQKSSFISNLQHGCTGRVALCKVRLRRFTRIFLARTLRKLRPRAWRHFIYNVMSHDFVSPAFHLGPGTGTKVCRQLAKSSKRFERSYLDQSGQLTCTVRREARYDKSRVINKSRRLPRTPSGTIVQSPCSQKRQVASKKRRQMRSLSRVCLITGSFSYLRNDTSRATVNWMRVPKRAYRLGGLGVNRKPVLDLDGAKSRGRHTAYTREFPTDDHQHDEQPHGHSPADRLRSALGHVLADLSLAREPTTRDRGRKVGKEIGEHPPKRRRFCNRRVESDEGEDGKRTGQQRVDKEPTAEGGRMAPNDKRAGRRSRDHKVIEEVPDLWHGSGNFVSFRGLLFHLLRTAACEISSRSSCIFLFLLLGFPFVGGAAIFELWRIACH
ncbi:hypothetical protein WN51_06987 [Melipona quadrifasciata]|uniref:Coilin N-terminal domain-containing protein n=1 Tax=Melipona quadrifasciata TaxID=166423 RepID=A0A0M8ZSU2_9HYME|nr:hypothetical protein WN51_06987 [Melipona quadrifasciata]